MSETIRFDKGAELALLGAVVVDNRLIDVVRSFVTAEEFYVPAHALVWECMLTLNEKRMAIDAVALASELKDRNRLNTVTQVIKLDELSFYGLNRDNIETYARIVAGNAIARRVETFGRAIVLKGQSAQTSITELVDFATTGAADIARKREERPVVWTADASMAFFERIESATQNTGGIAGLTTGLSEVDTLLTGLHPGQLVIVAARPAMGKTSLALNMARAAADAARKPAMFFSLEMSSTDLYQRLVCAEAGVGQMFVRSNTLSGEHMDRLARASQTLSMLDIAIVDDASSTLHDVRNRARMMQARHGLGVVFVDYLQLLSPSRGKRSDNREQEISEMSRGLKVLAMELRVPIVVLSQLSRKCESRQDKRPMLSDLRESGAIEQDADVVIFVYRDELYNKASSDRGIAELIVGKQRNGPTDTIKVRFRGDTTCFSDMHAREETTGVYAKADFVPDEYEEPEVPFGDVRH